MATHSSVLAWRIPGMGEPGGLPSMGSHSIRHDWSDLAVAEAAMEPRWKPEHWNLGEIPWLATLCAYVTYQCKEGNISREQKRLPIWNLPRLCLMGLQPWLDPFPLISHICDYNNFQWVLWNFQINYQNWGCLRKSLQICNWSQM